MKTSQAIDFEIKDAANPEPLPERLGKRFIAGASSICEVTRRFSGPHERR
jgi:hypothetical protein